VKLKDKASVLYKVTSVSTKDQMHLDLLQIKSQIQKLVLCIVEK
jgi:hypothetical protein